MQSLFLGTGSCPEDPNILRRRVIKLRKVPSMVRGIFSNIIKIRILRVLYISILIMLSMFISKSELQKTILSHSILSICVIYIHICKYIWIYYLHKSVHGYLLVKGLLGNSYTQVMFLGIWNSIDDQDTVSVLGKFITKGDKYISKYLWQYQPHWLTLVCFLFARHC